MRTIIVYVLLLVVTGGSLVGAEKSAPMEIVVGTYRKGSNIMEPRPAESRYFKTTLGGFVLVQWFAGYKWFIEVSKHPKKQLYTRSIIENPQDPKQPFVYDGTIDSTTPSTTITHGPALGLKSYQDYTVEFIAYADEKRTKEVDRLTQKIRSYVDTTGPELKLFSGLKTKTTDSLKETPAPAVSEKK